MASIALALLGCGVDEPADSPSDPVLLLEALPELRVEVTFNDVITPDQSRRVAVRLTHDPIPGEAGDARVCPLLHDSAAVSVASVPGEVASRGGRDGSRCAPLTFELSLARSVVAAESPLVVRDDSMELQFSLGDILAPRDLQPVEHSSWTFPAGETASFTWSPASDLDDHSTAHVLGMGIDLHPAEVEASEIVVPFPALPAEGTLRFVVSSSRSCGERCFVQAYQVIEHAALIVP